MSDVLSMVIHSTNKERKVALLWMKDKLKFYNHCRHYNWLRGRTFWLFSTGESVKFFVATIFSGGKRIQCQFQHGKLLPKIFYIMAFIDVGFRFVLDQQTFCLQQRKKKLFWVVLLSRKYPKWISLSLYWISAVIISFVYMQSFVFALRQDELGMVKCCLVTL